MDKLVKLVQTHDLSPAQLVEANTFITILPKKYLEIRGKERRHSLLHAAAEFGHRSLLQALIEKGLDPTYQDTNGSTPLHIAAANGQVEAVTLLLQYTAADLPNQKGMTPIALAVKDGNLLVLDTLLASKPTLNLNTLETKQKNTPLLLAVIRKRTDIVAALLRNGANTQVSNDFKSTPLHWAAFQNTPLIALQLIQRGANINAKDNNDETPLMLAAEAGNTEVLGILLTFSEQIDEENIKKAMEVAVAKHPQVVLSLEKALNPLTVVPSMAFLEPGKRDDAWSEEEPDEDMAMTPLIKRMTLV